MAMKLPRLPFGIKKHYLRPLLRFITDRRTYRREYDARRFFDQFHDLTASRHDRVTISPDFPEVDSRFHYNAVENQIIAHVKKNDLDSNVVLDFGSGNGHWIDFFLEVFGASKVYGVDISEVAVRKLEERFRDRPEVEIFHSDVVDLDRVPAGSLDLITSIGVMFHIVSDEKWEETVRWCHKMLRPGGVWIASGLLGMVTANVQFEPKSFATVEEYKEGDDLVCNKRVRSRRYWRKVLRRSGFRSVTFRKTVTPAPIHVPENNMLFAVK